MQRPTYDQLKERYLDLAMAFIAKYTENFVCDWCGEAHKDGRLIKHTEGCPVGVALEPWDPLPQGPNPEELVHMWKTLGMSQEEIEEETHLGRKKLQALLIGQMGEEEYRSLLGKRRGKHGAGNTAKRRI